MLRWIILAEAFVYLFVMPSLRESGDPGYHPPLLIGVIAIFSFAIGAFWFWRSAGASQRRPTSTKLGPRPHLWLGIVLLSILYDYVSARFGLIDRRQGSEYMAQLYGTLPLWSLAVLRIYELLFIPTIIIYMLSDVKTARSKILTLYVAIFVSLPFMGLATSRSRLIIIAMTILAFVPVASFVRYSLRNIKPIVGIGLVILSFTYVSANRDSRYSSRADYLQAEVFERLDGLNLVTELRNSRKLPLWGTWDLEPVAPLISKISFLKAAREAKLSGRTSSKQYYLLDVLNSRTIDAPNSMITDPLYIFGILGMVLTFIAFGLCCRIFDNFVISVPLRRGRVAIALAFAFASSFILFEVDFLGCIAALLQTWVLMLLFVLAGCKRYPIRRPGTSTTGRKTGQVLARGRYPAALTQP